MNLLIRLPCLKILAINLSFSFQFCMVSTGLSDKYLHWIFQSMGQLTLSAPCKNNCGKFFVWCWNDYLTHRFEKLNINIIFCGPDNPAGIVTDAETETDPQHSRSHRLWLNSKHKSVPLPPVPVVDPEFLRGGRGVRSEVTSGEGDANLLFDTFLHENCMEMRNWTRAPQIHHCVLFVFLILYV